MKKERKTRKQRGRPSLPNALVIEKKGDVSYAKILNRIKKDQALKDAGTCIQKVRRTNTGNLLIVLKKESSGMAPKLHKAMEGVLGSEAVVRSRIQEIDLEIKDIDEVTMKEEDLEVIQ